MNIEYDGDVAKVSEYVTVKVGLPNYSNVEVSFGHSRTCDNDPPAIRKMATEIHLLNKKFIERRLHEYVALAEEIADKAN